MTEQEELYAFGLYESNNSKKVQFRTVDRLLTYILNESLLKDNQKMQIKVNSVNQDDDNESIENKPLDEKLARVESLRDLTNE